jgi:hypothetical protein
VRAAFDQDSLYFAFLMKDSQPDKIWAELTPRNARSFALDLLFGPPL